MSQVTMQSLFAAAREDAPDDTTHDAMWNGIADATGMAATATAAATAAGAAKPAAVAGTTAAVAATAPKLLLIGAFIGAVSAAIGGVVALGWVESETGVAPASSANAPIARAVHVPARGATLADPRPRMRDPDNVDRPTGTVNVIVSEHVNAGSPPASKTGDLAEEARIVTEARAAIVGGDPARALTLLRTTHRFTTRALEPEELSLEARALRALGRIDEAAAMELTLKSRFPSHALAR